MTETNATPGRWMKVTFYGCLPEGNELFGEPHPELLDLTGKLCDLFGFTGLAHLTVSEGVPAQADPHGAQ